MISHFATYTLHARTVTTTTTTIHYTLYGFTEIVNHDTSVCCIHDISLMSIMCVLVPDFRYYCMISSYCIFSR